MSKDYRNCILDMLEAANKVLEYCKDTTQGDFFENELLMDAVQRQIIIIGEAARAFPKELQEKHPFVEWGKIIGLRNILVHQYAGIEDATIWSVVRTSIPKMVEGCRRILAEMNGED